MMMMMAVVVHYQSAFVIGVDNARQSRRIIVNNARQPHRCKVDEPRHGRVVSVDWVCIHCLKITTTGLSGGRARVLINYNQIQRTQNMKHMKLGALALEREETVQWQQKCIGKMH